MSSSSLTQLSHKAAQEPRVLVAFRAALVGFVSETTQRLDKIEAMMGDIMHAVGDQQHHQLLQDKQNSIPERFGCALLPTSPPASPLLPLACLPSPSVAAPVVAVPPAASAPVVAVGGGLELEVCDVECRWFTKRAFPDFEVRVVDARLPGRPLWTRTNEWAVVLRLVSGHDLEVNHFLSSPSTLRFPVVGGRAFISGLRFNAVSSRNGGHFRMEFSVDAAALGGSEEEEKEGAASKSKGKEDRALVEAIGVAVSPDVQILSERLKNEQKAVSVLQLKASDPLVRAPGIGKKYAKKLAEQGLHTIRDLAMIDNSPSSRDDRLKLLNSVRRERGALTEAKLAEMLRDAKTVVRRDDGADDNHDGPDAEAEREGSGSNGGNPAIAAAVAAAAAAAASAGTPAPSPATAAIKRKLEQLSRPLGGRSSNDHNNHGLPPSPHLGLPPIPVFAADDNDDRNGAHEGEDEDEPCAKRVKLAPSPLVVGMGEAAAAAGGLLKPLELEPRAHDHDHDHAELDNMSWDAMINTSAFYDDGVM